LTKVSCARRTSLDSKAQERRGPRVLAQLGRLSGPASPSGIAVGIVPTALGLSREHAGRECQQEAVRQVRREPQLFFWSFLRSTTPRPLSSNSNWPRQLHEQHCPTASHPQPS